MSYYMILTGDGNELANGLQTEELARKAAQRHANNINASVYYCEAREGAEEIEVTPRRYVISHRENGQWHWDANANPHGETTAANLPQEVYDLLEEHQEKGEYLEVTVDNVLYRVEAE